jgi:hypothetical protein
MDNLLEKISDEKLQNEISPGRNRGIYLLGHLAAVHDMMIPLLNLGNRFYMQLDEAFIKNADKIINDTTTATELRSYWKNINSILSDHFNKMQPEQWFEKHNSVSAEDFIKEPHRNKLNVIISRTNHMSYHIGQLALLK